MRFSLIAVTLLVGGCGTTGMITYGFKEGTTVRQMDGDSFECDVESSQQVPPNPQVRRTPPYITPVLTHCDGGICFTTGGHLHVGRTYSYDANKPLREEYFARCMAMRGYQTVRLPACDSSRVSPDLKQKLAGMLRPPREGACVSRLTERTGNVVYPEELDK